MSEENDDSKHPVYRWIAVIMAVATPCITFYGGYVRQSDDIRQLQRNDKEQYTEIRDLRNRVRTTEQDIAVIKQGTITIKEDVKELLREVKDLSRK